MAAGLIAARRGYVDIDGGQLHYRRAGSAAGVPLVLLHQSPSSSVMYEPLMQVLGEQFTLIAPDLPGFGASDALTGEVSIAGYAEALHQGLQALGIECYQLFGHHTGAAVAVQLAHEHPDKVVKLALSGPTLLSEELKAALPAKAAPFAPAEDGSHLLGMWQRMRGKAKSLPLALSLRETLLGLAVGEAYPEAYAAVIEQDIEPQLRALTCPVLVFAGDEDALFGCLDAAYACLRHGQRAVIAGGNSYVCEQQLPEVARLLMEFFAA